MFTSLFFIPTKHPSRNNYPKIKTSVDLPENSSWSNRRLVVFHLSRGMFKRTKTCQPWDVLMDCCFRGHVLHSRAKYIWSISENVVEGLKSIGKSYGTFSLLVKVSGCGVCLLHLCSCTTTPREFTWPHASAGKLSLASEHGTNTLLTEKKRQITSILSLELMYLKWASGV